MSKVEWLGEVEWLGDPVNCFVKCGYKPGDPDPGGVKAKCLQDCYASSVGDVVTLKYKVLLAQWSKANGGPELTPKYGEWGGDVTGPWDCFRDGKTLSAFSKWWNNKTGANLSVGSIPNSGECKNVLNVELSIPHQNALDEWSGAATWPSPPSVTQPGGGGAAPPGGGTVAPPDCAQVCQGKTGLALAICLTNCQGSVTTDPLPGGGCPAGQVLVDGKCAPASIVNPPPPEKKTPWGLIVLGGLALAGAAAWALGAFGGGLVDNPYPWTPTLPQNTTAKLRLSRVNLNRGGYDARGRYWGVGAPLFFAEDDDGNHRALRAASREDAKRQFPNAKWYRD